MSVWSLFLPLALIVLSLNSFLLINSFNSAIASVLAASTFSTTISIASTLKLNPEDPANTVGSSELIVSAA